MPLPLTWRWAGPVLMLVTSIAVLAGDNALVTGVRYGDSHHEWGLHLGFPFRTPASFTISTRTESTTISWGSQWSILCWLLTVYCCLDALVTLAHVLKFRNIYVAAALCLSSMLLLLANIVLRVMMYQTLISLFSPVTCDVCNIGEGYHWPLIGSASYWFNLLLVDTN